MERVERMQTQSVDDVRLELNRNAPLRLLLIEDSAADSDLVLAMLQDQFPHASIDVEVGLDAALVKLSTHRFDLVLADLSLPGAQGAPVVRAVRSAHPEPALMVLTGGVDGDLAIGALGEGAQDYLLKGQLDAPRLASALLHALQRQRANEESYRFRHLAQGLLDALDAPTCAVDAESTIVAVNQAWREFAEHNGGTAESCGVGTSYLDTCGRSSGAGGDVGAADAAAVGHGLRDVLAGSLARFHHDYPCHSATEDRWFTARVTPAVINEGRGAVITHLDITDMRQIQESLAHRSLHDPLTDLPNRALLLGRLEQAVSDADRQVSGVAVTHLDLHRFRRVNDQLGYHGGDAVLISVAERLQARLRPGDTLTRVSGDEFLVLWRDLDPTRSDEALVLSEGLLRSLNSPFEVSDGSLSLAASAGVACHAPGQSAEDLLQAAAMATHEAKKRGAGHVVTFTQELREAVGLRRTLEAELRSALERPDTEFVLHYQPVVDLASGTVVGVESLVRWQHPARGLLGPDRFVPLAEATGLIHELGDWVLGRALRDAALLTHGGRELDIAVNFSVRQLDADAVTRVQQALESSGVRPGRLILEITESALVEDEQTTFAALEGLSQLGVKIAVDDFGTGYCSLLYLRRYPVNAVKIDREFVGGLVGGADDQAICGGITGLAAAVGAVSVGEGVETMEQYAVLRSLGCQHGQGYLWSPPVPIEKLGSALASCDQVPVAASRSRTAPVRAGTRQALR